MEPSAAGPARPDPAQVNRQQLQAVFRAGFLPAALGPPPRGRSGSPAAEEDMDGSANETTQPLLRVDPAAGNPVRAGDGLPWVTLAGAWPVVHPEEPPSWRRVVAAVAAISLGLFVGVALAGTITARRAAEREAVNDALQLTALMAHAVVEPALEDGLTSRDPVVAAAARGRLDDVVRSRLMTGELVRVKIWTPQGLIVYSDEARLVGQTFALDDEERAVLTQPATRADVSDLTKPENRYEQSAGRLLEVYRPVWTPQAQVLLFETYTRYDAVAARSSQLWRGFAGITLSSLLLLLLAQAPLTWALVRRVRRAQRQRLELLDRAVSASEGERRRIAATLHDGAVQELAASAFAVAGAAERARLHGDAVGEQRLVTAAATVRASIGGLSSLLVDIYPPSLRGSGLAAAMSDLVAPLRSRELDVTLDVPDGLQLPADVEEVVFRVAQECLRNVARHAHARRVAVRLRYDEGEPGHLEREVWGGRVLLEIGDDGVGFDAGELVSSPAGGHFGLRLMADLASGAGATLDVLSAPGRGTRWRLEVPVP